MNNEILNVIKEYATEPNTDYAILLDGEWGSGKTFFVLNSVVKELKEIKAPNSDENVKVIYVSVYGFTSSEQLDEAIADEIIKCWNENELSKKKSKVNFNKAFEVIGSKANAVLKNLNPNFLNIDFQSFKKVLATFQNYSNYFIIIDDIERCNMPVNELFGHINSYVEHEGVKILLVANEKEIEKNQLCTDLELKYLTSALSIKKQENEISKNDIEKRAYELFSDELSYNKIKEKLVRYTLHYSPDIESNYITMLENIIEDKKIIEILDEEKSDIILFLSRTDSFNLRTLKFALDIVNKVYKILSNVQVTNLDGKYEKICLKEVIYYIFIASFNYKAGKELKSDKENNRILNSHSNINAFERDYIEFYFINDIVKYGITNRASIIVSFDLSVGRIEKLNTKKDDPLNKLKYYWEMDDGEIEESLNDLHQKIIRGEYDASYFAAIVLILVKLEMIGFKVEILNKIFISLKQAVEGKICDKLKLNMLSVENDREKELFNSKIKELEMCINDNNDKMLKEKFQRIFNGIDFVDKFYSFYEENQNNKFITKEKKLLSFAEVDIVVNAISRVNAREVREFGRVLNTIYGFSNISEYFGNDKDFVFELIDKLEKIDKSSYTIMKKYNLEFLLESLRNIYTRLNNNKIYTIDIKE